jgi:hypothetical protein
VSVKQITLPLRWGSGTSTDHAQRSGGTSSSIYHMHDRASPAQQKGARVAVRNRTDLRKPISGRVASSGGPEAEAKVRRRDEASSQFGDVGGQQVSRTQASPGRGAGMQLELRTDRSTSRCANTLTFSQGRRRTCRGATLRKASTSTAMTKTRLR